MKLTQFSTKYEFIYLDMVRNVELSKTPSDLSITELCFKTKSKRSINSSQDASITNFSQKPHQSRITLKVLGDVDSLNIRFQIMIRPQHDSGKLC